MSERPEAVAALKEIARAVERAEREMARKLDAFGRAVNASMREAAERRKKEKR